MSASPATRRTGPSALRSYSWLTLAATLFAASALLTGDIWLTRIGALVAFSGGLTSNIFAWREVKLQRRASEAQSVADLQAHGQKLHAERSQHARLLRLLQDRNGELRGRFVALRAETALLSGEIATLRGDNASLTMEVADLRSGNASLTAEVARLTDAQTAEILGLPRRVSGSVFDAEEVLWSEEDHPTVVDLKAITAPFSDSVLRAEA